MAVILKCQRSQKILKKIFGFVQIFGEDQKIVSIDLEDLFGNLFDIWELEDRLRSKKITHEENYCP